MRRAVLRMEGLGITLFHALAWRGVPTQLGLPLIRLDATRLIREGIAIA